MTVALASALVVGCADRADMPSALVGLTVRGCDPGVQLGSGMFVTVEGIDEPLVLTAAHTLRGAREIVVHRGDGHGTGSGRIVAFDPEMDLALVAVDGFTSFTPLTLAGDIVDSDTVGSREDAVAYVVRNGERTALTTTIERRVTIRTEDIYVDADTERPGLELTADIDPGDSGGAVVMDGAVVGVIWARSRRDGQRAYAIDPVRAGERVLEQVRTEDLGDVDLSRCR